MRLTQIKLAGFKSFVDPTVIHFPGQRVGVVGPNGCGKSNVIDAVRWVLGETRARELRGETMQDVIFSGSATRKPIGRASVELVFDNSLGKAAGQWSQYAEIAVKRVLLRNGDSSYYLNNLHVRRRDVADIFLGTGLGARAYAIIEQGMISRIIEARPEELRIFLEEAAGVSKYKERRRETESRLKDARENLLRVDDIRRELAAQIQRLESQAEVARRFLDLQQQLEQTHNLFRLLKKREAQGQGERWQREVQRLTNALEAETAALRQTETLLEQTREAHYAAGDALHTAQGALYSANAEVARIEQGLQHQRETRQRLESRLADLREQEARLGRQRAETQAEQVRWQGELEESLRRRQQTAEQLEQETRQLPLAEEAFRDCQRRHSELQRSFAQAQQSAQIEEAHRTHAQKAIQQLTARRGRLEQEKAALPRFDAAALASKEADLREAGARLEAARAAQEAAQQALPVAEQARREAAQAMQAARESTAGLEARLAALRQLQGRLEQNQSRQAWLAKHGLETLSHVWRELSVTDGWDDALESVLRERLDALLIDRLEGASWLGDAPALLLAAVELSDAQTPDEPAPQGLVPLSSRVSWRNLPPPAWLRDWLHGVYLLDDPQQAMTLRHHLPPGALLVTRPGHWFTRFGAGFYAPQSELHGVLARQREIEQLDQELVAQHACSQEAQSRLEAAEQALSEAQQALAACRSAGAEQQQRVHALQLETQKLAQLGQQVTQRHDKIEEELAEIKLHAASEAGQLAAGTERYEEAERQIEALREELNDVRRERSEAENRLHRQRESLRGAERAAQEADFAERGCRSKLTELEQLDNTLAEQLEEVRAWFSEQVRECEAIQDASLQAALQQALAAQHEREQAMAAARNALEEITANLRETETQRLTCEQKLNPLRDQIGEVRLKEQEARLAQEQFGAQLAEAGADEAALAELLTGNPKASGFQTEMTRLQGEISELGAVNLAALEELVSAGERQSYLQAQGDDLNAAIETLEQAIRRIDRETRERLQATFDEANRHLSELFPSLFGGGEARLVMTGEEILDAGIQIIAQPPGKKNTSIHLLSGGEKALTALSLTFSLFQLNPAPFCLLDEVDAPLDDSNTERFCNLVRRMSAHTQFVFISHNKITMEMAEQLVGVTMREQGVSRVVEVDIAEAMRMRDAVAA